MDDKRVDREGSGLIGKIRGTSRGIFFVHARWSAGSVWALAKLREHIRRHAIASDDVIYLDADDDEKGLLSLLEFRGICNGWGEVFVVRDGQIVYATNLGREKDQFDSRWNQVLCEFNSEE